MLEIGEMFGELTVIQEAGQNARGKAMVFCRCSCGEPRLVQRTNLLSGNTTSCGHVHRSALAQRQLRHGKRSSAEYSTWTNMRSRCLNKNNRGYPGYGGRGIKICSRWENFENFFADMGCRPGKTYSLERIDVNGNYEPSNCRWATKKEQANNRRTSRFITFGELTDTVSRWCEALQIPEYVVRWRLNKGWEVFDALVKPIKGANK